MSIIENAKEIADLIKKYNDQDLYERIIALREEILSLREENLSLKEKIKALEASTDIQHKITRKGNVYVFTDDPSGKKNMYCMACWDYERKLVNVYTGPGGIIRCHICMDRKTPHPD